MVLPRWPALLLLLAGLLAALWSFRAVQSNPWDTALLHLYASMAQPAAHTDTILVAIDDKSLNEIGPWPWPRSVHGDIVQALAASATLVYDVAFIGGKQFELDQQLVAAVKQHGQVVMPLLAERNPKTLGLDTLLPYSPLPSYALLGHVDTPLNHGVFTTLYLKAGNNNAQHPYLALAALAATEDDMQALPGLRQAGQGLPRNGLWVRDFANVFIPSKAQGSVEPLSAVDVLSGTVDASVFAGKTVFVGPTSNQIATAVPVLGLHKPLFDVQIQQQVYHLLKQQQLLQRASNQWGLVMALVCWSLGALLLWSKQRHIILLVSFALFTWLIVLPPIIAWFAGVWVLQGYGLLAAVCCCLAYAVDRVMSRQLWLNVLEHRDTKDYLSTVNEAFATAPIDGVFAVIIVQCDHFQRYFAENGRRKGFQALRAVRKALVAQLHKSVLGVSVFSDHSLVLCALFEHENQAEQELTQLAASVEHLGIVHDTSSASSVATVSCGVAFVDIATLDQPELLVGNAEVALKQAIAQGRNQVCVFK